MIDTHSQVEFHSLILTHAAATEGIDCHVVHGYVVHNLASKTSVDLSYPLDSSQNVMTGRSYHHGRFIMGLRREAQETGYILVLCSRKIWQGIKFGGLVVRLSNCQTYLLAYTCIIV